MTEPYRYQTDEEAKVLWHGSASGDLRGGKSGLHLGTCLAAKQALEATIGRPVEGEWDGTREYGKTLLWGRARFRSAHETPTGYNADTLEEDHYPTGKACFSNLCKIPMTMKPSIRPYEIVGCMTNSPWRPHEDFKANGYMKAQLKKGTARCGYYYSNVSEDAGSISAVVPRSSHIEELPGIASLRAKFCLGKRR